MSDYCHVLFVCTLSISYAVWALGPISMELGPRQRALRTSQSILSSYAVFFTAVARSLTAVCRSRSCSSAAGSARRSRG